VLTPLFDTGIVLSGDKISLKLHPVGKALGNTGRVRTATAMARKAKTKRVAIGATTYHFFEITQRRKQKYAWT
jgi:hypothetical protein